MLSRIKIKKLFNLYDYDITLANGDGSKVKFITAPNGYGKTTILGFVDGVMKQSYDLLFQTPFRSFAIYFNEEKEDAVFCVAVERTEEQPNLIDTDVNENLTIALEVSLTRMTDFEENLIERYKVVQHPDGSVNNEGNSGNIEMFFVARSGYYLTDSRILKLKTDIDEETLDLDAHRNIGRYVEDMKAILKSPETSLAYKDRIETFKRIIDRCDFANKHLEIDKRFGFRFVAHDVLETKLSLAQLSSGEKHMIVQVFELLFRAKEGTLVLIDEPELSLHMMWQMNYLKNLEEIVALRNFQCIVATHSPQIFNSMWSKSVDLFMIANQNNHDAIA